MTKKKVYTVVGVLVAFLVGLGVFAIAFAPSASAHDAEVTGTAVCAEDGTYTVTWTVQTTNVPAGEEGEVKVISPENLWLYEWAEHYANHGLPPLAPNASFTWTQTGIPGTATEASVMFQIDWHGYSHDPTGKITLEGVCTTPEEPPTVPEEPPVTPEEPPVTPEEPQPSESPSEEPTAPPVAVSEPPVTTDISEPTVPVSEMRTLPATGANDRDVTIWAGVIAAVLLGVGIPLFFYNYRTNRKKN